MAWSDLIQVLVARLLLLTVVVDLHGILASPSISGQSATIVNGGAASATAIDTRTDSVQQYYIEHTIGQKDASAAFKQMAKELINSTEIWCSDISKVDMALIIIIFAPITAEPKPAWCQECTQTIVRYCLDHRMLHDHCCCDSGHARGNIYAQHVCMEQIVEWRPCSRNLRSSHIVSNLESSQQIADKQMCSYSSISSSMK